MAFLANKDIAPVASGRFTRGIHAIESEGDGLERAFYDGLDMADGMVCRDQLVWSKDEEPNRLLRCVAAHGSPFRNPSLPHILFHRAANGYFFTP